MKYRSFFLATSIAVLTACGGTSTSPTTTAKPALTVGAVYFGETSNNSWSAANEMPISGAASDDTTISESQNISDDSNAELVLEQMAAAGNKLIFATWPGYSDAVQKVALKYPNTCFQLAGDALATPLKNVGTYTANFNEGRYLTGMAAGATTKSGKIGFIASFPTADAIAQINAFTLGAQAMNSEAKVQVTWTATKFDELLEQQAAESLIRAGADVIAQSTHSIGPGKAAEANGVNWVGNDISQPDKAPTAWLTAPAWQFAHFVSSTIADVRRGTCPTAHYEATRANQGVQIGEFGPAIAELTKADIAKAVPDLSSIAGKTDFIDGVVGSAQG